MDNTILIVIAAAAALFFLMRRKPSAAVAGAAYKGAYTGASAAGLSTLAGWGALAGGITRGLTAPSQPSPASQPPAAVGVSSSATVGLGDAPAPALSDDDIMALIG
jgi:hypothetical protein